MDNLALQTTQRAEVINIEDYAMTAESVIKQVALIQRVMESIMKKDEHYGTIPGCKKPSLLKPGAEKLSVTFRLVPKYDVMQNDYENGHREFRVTCTLIHAPTGQFYGEGVGSCSTLEGKYRFRTGEVELTGKAVPSEYWKDRDLKLIGGKGFVTKKNPDTGKWEIARQGERVEHDNPADYYNTVLKMAKKRAHVDAVLTATAASDIFTQDVEDMPEVIPGAADPSTNGHTESKTLPAEPQKKAESKPESKQEIKDPNAPASEPQLKAIHAMLKKVGVTDDYDKHERASQILCKPEVIASFNTLTKAEASKIIDSLNKEIEAK